MGKFKFQHMKTPAWSCDSANSIYFKVICNETEIGYIGCQENDLGRGLCNNFCYKTFESFRNQGLTKAYIGQFIKDKVLDFDCIRAKVPRDNIPSQRVLEANGFENRGKRDDGKYGYTWKAF